jgi:HEAT repeat protein
MTDEKYGQNKAVDVLNARALHQKREYVRDLVNRGDTEALSLLVECMCDDSWFLRDLAEQAFPRLGDRGASALIPLLDKGLWFSRTSAARVLGRMGYRPAVPHLLQLAEDGNRTVADAARESVMVIAHQKGTARLAHALHRLPPDQRRSRLDEIGVRDRPLADRIERLMRSEDLMNVSDPDGLSDDSPSVQAAEDGVEWEVLTGPPNPSNSSPPNPKLEPEAGAEGRH